MDAWVPLSQKRNPPGRRVRVFSMGGEMKILFFGDSKDLPQTISLILKVRWSELSLISATEAREGMKLIHGEQPDIVMLHFPERSEGSPALDCFDLITQIRSFSDVPILILSQSNDVMDKVRALEMGADDWIAPSSIPMEFIAKVNAILRRCSPRNNNNVDSFFGDQLSIK